MLLKLHVYSILPVDAYGVLYHLSTSCRAHKFPEAEHPSILPYPGSNPLPIALTDHMSYDYDAIVSQSKIIVDTRNACRNIQSNKVIKS
jgi:hypothetical protein